MVQELLGGVGPLPLHHHRLLVAQNGSSSGDGGHVQIRVVLVLPDHVPDASRGGLGILADGGPHTGSTDQCWPISSSITTLLPLTAGCMPTALPWMSPL